MTRAAGLNGQAMLNDPSNEIWKRIDAIESEINARGLLQWSYRKPCRFRIRPVFAWFDLWVGAYWDRRQRRLYILPLPCCGIVVEFRP